jgi:hypothetical protein
MTPDACSHKPHGGLRGQSELMEYMLMVVFLVAAIIGLILFLTWWSGTQLQAEGFKDRQDRVTSIAKSMMAEPMLVNTQSVFDDAKLTALISVSPCVKLQDMYGEKWYAKIKSLDMSPDRACTWSDYPVCNAWSICSPPAEKRTMLVQKFPVNVYRKLSDRVSLGILEVGVYS